MALVWGSDRSPRAARQRSPVARIRDAGSARATGTRKRSRVIRLPAAGSSGVRMLMGRVTRSSPTGAPVVLVVAAQPARHRGHEPVVQRPAGGFRRRLQLGEVDLEHGQPTPEAAGAHDGGGRVEHGGDRPAHRTQGLDAAAGPPQRMAADVPQRRPRRAGRAAQEPQGLRCFVRNGAHHELGPAGHRAGGGVGKGARRGGEASGVGVEEHEEQLHPPDAVGEGVVHLHDEGGPPADQVLDEGELPQRVGGVETGHGGHPRQVEDRLGCVGRRGPHPA